MAKKIWLTTADGFTGVSLRSEPVDVISVEYRLYTGDKFEGAKQVLRERAWELHGDAVIGITFEYTQGGVRAIGTVVQFDGH